MTDLDLRKRDAAMPGDKARPLKSELLHINMGPQHPATHGVLRLFLTTVRGEDRRGKHLASVHRLHRPHGLPRGDELQLGLLRGGRTADGGDGC
jgi:hypothetical protein